MELHAYVAQRGRQSALAAQIGVPPQMVWQWARSVRQVPAERCPDIERATDGQVLCEELRADVCWQRVPDPAWPHADGRPCIDVARQPSASEGQEARDAA